MENTEGNTEVKKIDADQDNLPSSGNVDGNSYSDEQLQKIAEKSGDSVEHIKEMLNVHNGGIDEYNRKKQAESTDRPGDGDRSGSDEHPEGDDLYAGKYKTPDELDKGLEAIVDKLGGKEKVYKLLESQLGKPSGEAGDSQTQESNDALSGDTNEDSVDSESASPQIDLNKYSQEFAEKGELSEDSFKELENAGVPKDFVNEYIAGQQAKAELWSSSVYEMAGGKENYNTLVDWARSNLTPQEKERFNTAVSSMDKDSTKIMLDALQARYEKANGSMQQHTIEPGTGNDGVSGNRGYQSQQEYVRDLKDPRYISGDKEFHRQVMAKLKATTIF